MKCRNLERKNRNLERLKQKFEELKYGDRKAEIEDPERLEILSGGKSSY